LHDVVCQDLTTNGNPLFFDDAKVPGFEERPSCLTDVRIQLMQLQCPGLLMNGLHQAPTDALSLPLMMHVEVINQSGGLHIGTAGDHVIGHTDERIDLCQPLAPFSYVDLSRGPCLHLSFGIVAQIHRANGVEKQLPKFFGVGMLVSANLHRCRTEYDDVRTTTSDVLQQA